MSESGAPGESSTSARRNPLVWWLAGAGLVLLLVGAGVLVAIAIGQQPQPEAVPDAPSASADPTETAAPDETESPEAPEPEATIDPRFGEPVADAVDGDETASFGDEVTARLIEVTPVTVTGSRAGEVSGPAIRVTVELENSTGESISLNAVTVNAYFGTDDRPAAPVSSDDGAEPFGGALPDGQAARGTYTFSIPEEQDEVVVTMSWSPDAPLVTFRH